MDNLPSLVFLPHHHSTGQQGGNGRGNIASCDVTSSHITRSHITVSQDTVGFTSNSGIYGKNPRAPHNAVNVTSSYAVRSDVAASWETISPTHLIILESCQLNNRNLYKTTLAAASSGFLCNFLQGRICTTYRGTH